MGAQEDGVIRAQRRRVELVLTFEVHEHELQSLQEGESVGVDLTFAVAFLSIAASAVFTLSTATFDNSTVKMFAIASLFPGAPVGLYFLWRWNKLRQRNGNLCKKIRDRGQEAPATPPKDGQLQATAEVPDKLPSETPFVNK
ncbi:hypothetical protein [Achromobacter sp. K91]|uniref:hypothetical protein n=1 Tax=Achromobacter sp. K91 TaxID=2292262 RepID=UPI0011C3BCB6|nr:hypothetical protein [Achromobacter sp. K91]